MKHIKEICKEIANELKITVPKQASSLPDHQLKMSDIMPNEEWISPGVTCLAARPRMGKTALAVELLLSEASCTEKQVVYFSLEAVGVLPSNV